MVFRVSLIALLAASLATSAGAGQIGYRINGGSTLTKTIVNPGDSVEIDLFADLGTTDPITTDTDVHIFDIITDDQVDTVGMITIRGSATIGTRIRVVVADENLVSVASAFEDATANPGAGIAILGGLTFAPPAAFPTDTSLRDSATVSINVGNLTGDVTAGRIFRVAALQDGLGNGGTISGTITSTQTDLVFYDEFNSLNYTPAIAYVEATRSISGNIIAQPVSDLSGTIFRWDPADDTTAFMTRQTWSSIGSVIIVGTGVEIVDGIPTPVRTAADVLAGDVKAQFGTIDQVVAGTIGPVGFPLEVSAGVRVGQIVSDSSATANVTVSAGARGKDPLGTSNALKNLALWLQAIEVPTSLQVLDVRGDLVGDINLFDVYGAQGTSAQYTYEGVHQGIFIHGKHIGSITVDYDYENADMIARSFRGPIEIGQLLRGTVVAVGRDVPEDSLDGTIHSIEVGFGGDPSNEDRFFAGPNPGEDGGFSGTFKTTLFAPLNGPGVRERWFDASFPYPTDRTKDSVIRAYQSIGSVRISAMSNGLDRDFVDPSFLRPRIESPSIDYLSIDVMEHGSVWSGTLIEYPDAPSDNITDNYASVGTLIVGCVGPAADLWLRDTALIDVQGDLAGEIHLLSLTSGQTLRVGNKFNDVEAIIDNPPDFCGLQRNDPFQGFPFGYDDDALKFFVQIGTDSTGNPIFGQPNQEPTPRSVWDQHSSVPFAYPVETNTTFIEFNGNGHGRGTAAYGRILIREPNGLQGQIIIDANNTGPQRAATHWLGDVEIGTGESPDIGDPNISVTPGVISTESSRATTFGSGASTGTGEGPRYTALPTSFGGGAVGLVPFALHDRATWPPNPPVGQVPPQVLLEPAINSPDDPIPGQGRTVDIEFYGPVRASGSASPVEIYMAPLDSPNSFYSTPVTSMFNVTVRRAGNSDSPSRLVVLSRPTGGYIPKAVYKVVPILDTSAPSYLFCDSLDSPTPVADFEYRFAVGGDCQPNGVADEYDIGPNGSSQDVIPDNGDGTFGNGIPDECDSVEPSPCPACAADYDQDGGVTGGDLAAFFFDFERGLDCADIDQNGGVDGGDIGAFFALFEAGGC